ncbi:MAG: GAF domain-containing protein [Actinomycetota bacterium]|nr:GAF domain-containing protein [Actinomycetota bacterium]
MGEDASALRRLLDVVGQLGAERRSEQVLRRILDGASALAGARYAAVGVPDGDGGFALFLTAGVDTHTGCRIGSLPRTHGLLGALLKEPEVIRRADIRADPRFRYYPHAHPDMRSLLGVPIMAGGEVVAALYLAEKTGEDTFPRPIRAWWKRSPDTPQPWWLRGHQRTGRGTRSACPGQRP